MNRPLLHAEELEGRIIADGPVCTCHSNNVCPMCGSAEADVGCAVHDGHELKELLEREPTDEELDARLEELDLDALLDGQEPNEVLEHIRAHDKDCVTDWLREETEASARGRKNRITYENVLGVLPGSAILSHLISEHGDLLREWINENVEAEMTTDDLGQKVPTLNITGL